MRIGPALGAQHAASRTVQAPPLLYFAPPLSGVATPSYQPMRPRFAGRARAEPEKPEKPPSPSPTISTIVNLVGAPGEDAMETGLPLQTINYRAPEVCFGDRNFSYPIDSWSLGCAFG